MGEIIRTLADGDKPLCPNNIASPANPAHQLHNRVLDAFYETAEKDADGEMVEAARKPYDAAAYGRVTDRMDLFRHSVGFAQGNQYVRVESWWFRCGICGFTLPAQRTET